MIELIATPEIMVFLTINLFLRGFLNHLKILFALFSKILPIRILVNLSPRAKREVEVIFVNLIPRAEQEAKGFLVNQSPRAKREAQGILVNVSPRAKREAQRIFCPFLAFLRKLNFSLGSFFEKC